MKPRLVSDKLDVSINLKKLKNVEMFAQLEKAAEGETNYKGIYFVWKKLQI